MDFLCIIILTNRFLVVSYTFFILHVYPALYAKHVNCPGHDNRVINSVNLWNICHPSRVTMMYVYMCSR